MRYTQSFVVSNPDRFKRQMLRWGNNSRQVVYLDGNSEDPSTGSHNSFDVVLALQSQRFILSDYKDAFCRLREFWDETKDWVFGCLSYDVKNDIEPLTSKNKDFLGFPDIYFFQPKKIVFMSGDHVTFSYLESCKDTVDEDFISILKTPIDDCTQKSKAVRIFTETNRDTYLKAFDKIQRYISEGAIYELNYCNAFTSCDPICPLTVFERLNELSPAPFSAFLKLDHLYVMCASPERFVKKKRQFVVSQPIKGTSERSENITKDKRLKRKLFTDKKERTENIMIADLTRNDLSKIAVKGSVKMDKLCHVASFPQVHQLISTVSCKVDDKTHPVDVIKALFPIPSMTGVPKRRALEIIEEIESFKRGLYSGTIGYITPDGDFDFNVVIRTILHNGSTDNTVICAGGAITSQSEPEKEYGEIMIKIKALMKSLNVDKNTLV